MMFQGRSFGGVTVLVMCLSLLCRLLNDESRIEAQEFRQQVHVPYQMESGLASNNISGVALHEDSLFVATDAGIASYVDGKWKTLYTSSSPIMGLTFAANRLWFVERETVMAIKPGDSAKQMAQIPQSFRARCIAVIEEQAYVGTDQGLMTMNNGELTPVESVNRILVNGPAIRQIAFHGGEIALAAMGGLVTLSAGHSEASAVIPSDGRGGWALRDVRGVAYDSTGSLWFASPQGCGCRASSDWRLWGHQDGIPWNDFTCLSAGSGVTDVWFGTTKGAIRFDGQRWEYRQGRRWLLDDNIKSLAVASNGDCWLATSAGLSRIESRKMTLENKAAAFHEAIDKYHKRTEYGYVDSVVLKDPSNFSEWSQHDSDNDGLWTSMYGAAQCFEYAATKSENSKKRAKLAFQAVAFLSEVTQGGTHSAPRGFPARTILPVTGSNPNLQDSSLKDKQRQKSDPLWKVIAPRWPTSADGKWYWKTDTSSDELDGHYFFYALYHDLVADTEEDKRFVRQVVDRVTSHLLENNFSLVDHDGLPTRWGQFGPDAINTDRLTDCRGLNSLSILSYLLVASHVTGDAKYQRAYRSLLYDHNYFTNLLSPKFQNGPGSGNQSDDEMAFMCYYNAFSYEHDPMIRRQFMRSMSRYFAQEMPEACPLFNFIFARSWEARSERETAVKEKALADANDTLKRYPLDLRQWAFENSQRLDVVALGSHIVSSRGKGHLRSGYVIPIDERNINHWNQDPWRLDHSGTGHELADGTAFLLPYWMGVHHKMIAP
ncbi:MAG: hypothetical protein ABL921_07660 [Pirellula sp.]